MEKGTALYAAHVALGPQGDVDAGEGNSLVLELLVDIGSGIIHDVATNVGSWLSQEMLRQILKGDSLLQPPQHTIDALNSRYHSRLRGPLVAAFLQIYRLFHLHRIGYEPWPLPEEIPASTLYLLSNTWRKDKVAGWLGTNTPPALADAAS